MKQYQTKEALEAPSSSRLERLTRRPKAVEIEESLDRLSLWLDGVFRIPGVGWRFGLDAIIGLIPGVGDTLTSLASFYILAAGVRYRVPKITLLRMGLNLGIDYVIGSIPIIGDLFDVAWKSNQKNVELLRKRATVSAEEAHKGRVSDWLFLFFIILILVTILCGSVVAAALILRYLFVQLSS